jgi:hypothetical protein
MYAQNVNDIDTARFTITYNPDELDVVDLCGSTYDNELTTGSIDGTNIEIVQFTPGKIVIMINATEPVQGFSGTVDLMVFRSKINGPVSLTYGIN